MTPLLSQLLEQHLLKQLTLLCLEACKVFKVFRGFLVKLDKQDQLDPRAIREIPAWLVLLDRLVPKVTRVILEMLDR
jgi:hypothetical protein